MSGGVDSSVTAALLKSEGYDVVGITLQLYDHGAATHRKGACCAGRDIHDARNVAERIGIPHYVLDYESRFRESVIDNFADSYALGETPVPCIECNRSIKFRDLLATARELGAQCARDRALCRLAPPRRRIARAGVRRGCRSRPELFPVRDHARAARLSALSARRHDQAAGARTGAALRPRSRRQAGQPGHLLRADRALHRHHRPPEARRDRARRHRRSRRPCHRPASGHRSFHRRPAQGAGHRLRRAALCRQARCGEPPRRGRAARGAADGSHPAARRQLDRRRRARARHRRGHRDVRARALDARAAAGLVARGRWRL